MNNKEFNFGIALLKLLMAFEVVLNHFWNDTSSFFLAPFNYLKPYAVPVFMIISIYFSTNCILSLNTEVLKRRITRLYIPFILWPIILFPIFYFVKNIAVKDLLMQLLFGHSYLTVLWFQFVLIIITILLYCLCYYAKNSKTQDVLLIVILVLSLVFQFTGLNYSIFSKLPYELSYPFGRICEMIPSMFLGFIMCKHNLMKNKYVFIILLLLTIACLLLPNIKGFGNSNLGIHFESALIVYIFYNARIENLFVQKILKSLNYSSSIYYLHQPIGYLLIDIISDYNAFDSIEQFILCIAITILCCIITVLIRRTNTKLGYILTR